MYLFLKNFTNYFGPSLLPSQLSGGWDERWAIPTLYPTCYQAGSKVNLLIITLMINLPWLLQLYKFSTNCFTTHTVSWLTPVRGIFVKMRPPPAPCWWADFFWTLSKLGPGKIELGPQYGQTFSNLSSYTAHIKSARNMSGKSFCTIVIVLLILLLENSCTRS